MAKLLFPFLCALVLGVAQPLFDKACAQTLQRNAYDRRSRDAAAWAGSASAFLPAAVLTVFGAVLVAADEGLSGTWILIVAVGLLVVSVLMFVREIVQGVPARDSASGSGDTWRYSALQVWVIVLNVVGIVAVIVFHFVGDA